MEDYLGIKSKIKMLHKSCGSIIYPQPYEFLSNSTRCRTCANKILSIGQKRFIEKVSNLTDESYEVLGEYINNHTNIEMRHKVCNQTFSPRPKSFLEGTRCPYCSGRRSNKETFVRELQNVVGEEYILVSDYVDKNNKVDLLHNRCEKIYKVKPVNFLKTGYRCPTCTIKISTKKRTKTHEQFTKELSEKFDGQIVPLEQYVNAHKKIKFKHLISGEIFVTKPGALLADNAGCSHCNQSLPESQISHILTCRGISFSKQYKLEGCTGKKNVKLPFDFAIYNEQGQLDLLLEYDGEHHYRPAFGESSFNTTRRNDEIKNNYCTSNNIKLIRIPYWEKGSLEKALSDA
ncbi:hypothetical protein [Paenibacillus taichungensis]